MESTLNFAEKPVQVLTLEELERSYHENMPTGQPVGGIYHFALIGEVLEAFERRGLRPVVQEIFAAANRDSKRPGVTLLPQEAEEMDDDHRICAEIVEDEYYVSMDHPMTKEHAVSFLAAVSDQGIQFVKLYPEGAAEARFKTSRVKAMYAYCNRHGLFEMKIHRPNQKRMK